MGSSLRDWRSWHAPATTIDDLRTGVVSLRHGRSFIGCELNPEYVALGRDRIIADSPLLNTHAEAA